jgi:hypothetical protein
MSAMDYKSHLLRAVDGLRAQGKTTEQIIRLVLSETSETPNPTPALSGSEPARMIAIEHANGSTRLVPWTRELQGQLDTNARSKAHRTLSGSPEETK